MESPDTKDLDQSKIDPANIQASLDIANQTVEELKRKLAATEKALARSSQAQGQLAPELEARVRERLAGLPSGTMSREQAIEIELRQIENDKAIAEEKAKAEEAAKKAPKPAR